MRGGQCDGNGAGTAVGVGDGEVGVLSGAGLIPCLRCYRPASEVDGGVGAVLELQRDAVVRPTLERDVVGAGGDRHEFRLATLADALLAATALRP